MRALPLTVCTLTLLLGACSREEAKAPAPAPQQKRVHGASPATVEAAQGNGGIAIVRPEQPLPGPPPRGAPRFAPGAPIPEAVRRQAERLQQAGDGGTRAQP